MITYVHSQHPAAPPTRRIAYMMSRFPKITETFILNEMLAMEQEGFDIELYPLLRERSTLMHPEAAPLVERANYEPFLSWSILRENWRFLRQQPRAYLGALGAVLRGAWGSPRFLLGALAIFPKTARLAARMKNDRIQHVHAHFASHPAAAAFIIRRLAGIPYSFTAHGSDLHRDRHMLKEKVAEAAFVVAISQYNREMIVRECGEKYRDKVAVIHCGVDTQLFQPSDRALRSDHRRGVFAILCIGTLHEVKGQRYLIEACRLLRERDVEFALHFVGDGPDMKELIEQTEQAKLTDGVTFHGRKNRHEIAQFVQRADVVAAPSVLARDGRREGIPVVLMEAMGSGTPVVASRISGIPELVEDGHNGYLTPPRDARALAYALERLSSDPALRRRLGQAGREKVLREFDQRRNASSLAEWLQASVQLGGNEASSGGRDAALWEARP